MRHRVPSARTLAGAAARASFSNTSPSSSSMLQGLVSSPLASSLLEPAAFERVVEAALADLEPGDEAGRRADVLRDVEEGRRRINLRL